MPACGVQDFDLCVLFGNLLDNALEACEKLPEGADRFVRIQARPVKNVFFLKSEIVLTFPIWTSSWPAGNTLSTDTESAF